MPERAGPLPPARPGAGRAARPAGRRHHLLRGRRARRRLEVRGRHPARADPRPDGLRAGRHRAAPGDDPGARHACLAHRRARGRPRLAPPGTARWGAGAGGPGAGCVSSQRLCGARGRRAGPLEASGAALPEPARLPRFVMGYAPLHVQVDSRRLAVALHPERDSYRPGERARIDLEVRDASGTGAASGSAWQWWTKRCWRCWAAPVPDPFGFFYQERPLAVSSGDTRLRLSAGARLEAARFKAEAGGDGAERLAARSLFTTTAYWNPAGRDRRGGPGAGGVRAPRQPHPLPGRGDRGQRCRSLRQRQAGFRVAKPLTVDPALPRFVLPGRHARTGRRGHQPHRCDRRAVPCAPRPTCGSSPRARRACSWAPASRSGSPSVPWPSTTGRARVRFEARLALESDAVEMTLAVPPRAPAAGRGHCRAGAPAHHARKSRCRPRRFPAAPRLEVALAPSALGGARPAYDYVVEYPYSCVEQLASRLLVLLTARDLFATTPAEAARDSAKIADTIGRLESLCLPWQGFSFWSGGPAAPQWLEAYAALALGPRSRARAGQVSEDVLQTASAGLRAPVAHGSARAAAPRRRAGQPARRRHLVAASCPPGSALLALSEHMQPGPECRTDARRRGSAGRSCRRTGPGRATRPGARPAPLGAAARRSSSACCGARSTARRGDRRRSRDRRPSTPAASAAAVPHHRARHQLGLWLGPTVRPDDPLVSRLATGLLATRAGGHWGTTQDDALALLALAAYRDQRRAAGRAGGATAPSCARPPRRSSRSRRGPAMRCGGPQPSPCRCPVARPPPRPSTSRHAGRCTTRRRCAGRKTRAGRRLARPASRSARRVDRFEGPGPVRLGDLVVVTLTVVVPRASWYLASWIRCPPGSRSCKREFAVESRQVARRSSRHGMTSTRRCRSCTASAATASCGSSPTRCRRASTCIATWRGCARPVPSHTLPARVEAMYTPELPARRPAARLAGAGPGEREEAMKWLALPIRARRRRRARRLAAAWPLRSPRWRRVGGARALRSLRRSISRRSPRCGSRRAMGARCASRWATAARAPSGCRSEPSRRGSCRRRSRPRTGVSTVHPGLDARGDRPRRVDECARRADGAAGGSTLTQQLAGLLWPEPRTLGGQAARSGARRAAGIGSLEAGHPRAVPESRRLTGPERVASPPRAAPSSAARRGRSRRARRRAGGPAASALPLRHRGRTHGTPPPARCHPGRHGATGRSRRGGLPRRRATASSNSIRERAPFAAPHFADWVLATRPPGLQRAARIETTLDAGAAAEVEGIVAAHLAGLRGRGVHEMAVVVQEMPSGEVLALVGSPSWSGVAGERRARAAPAGLGAEAVRLCAGLRAGLSPADRLADLPLAAFDGQGGEVAPRNYDGRWHGPVRAREALASSFNVPAVRCSNAWAPSACCADVARRGPRDLDGDAEVYGLGLVLGVGEVTLLDLTNAYAGLARGGVWRPPSRARGERCGGADARAATAASASLDRCRRPRSWWPMCSPTTWRACPASGRARSSTCRSRCR